MQAAMEGTDDARITELLRSRQFRPAFDLVVQRHGPAVFRLCCALLRNRAEAEDVAQESLVRIWKNLDSYDGRAALSTWIHAITRNRCLTALERRRAELSLSDETVARAAEEHAAPEPSDVHDVDATLRELVAELPDNYRRCLQLYYYEEQSVDTVARLLALPAGTVKTHLHRARGLLAVRLKSLGLADARLWLEEGA